MQRRRFFSLPAPTSTPTSRALPAARTLRRTGRAPPGVAASAFHIVTLGDSPIRSIAELKGKTVSVGPARSRSEKLTLRLLEALDPSVATSWQRAALGLSESMWALAEKKIDAFAWHGPVSPALFEHLAGLLKIRLMLLSYEEGVAKLRQKYAPAYSPALIRQGAYAWLEQEVAG